MSHAAAFPRINGKPHAHLKEDLPGQIYTIDGFLSPQEVVNIRKWGESIGLQDPVPPRKGEAERTARRGTLDSPEVASALLTALQPYLAALDPPYTPSVPLLSPNIRVYHYPSKTFFRGHYDSPQMDTRSKRLSCWTILIYLSDGVKGGGTTFWLDDPDRDSSGSASKGKKAKTVKGKEGKLKAGTSGVSEPRKITIEPKAGRLLLHWHGVARGGCMLHEGEEVLAGDKWVLRTDILA